MGEEAAEAAPGPDLGPEEHTIKVFLSGNSGNKEVRECVNKLTFTQNKISKMGYFHINHILEYTS